MQNYTFITYKTPLKIFISLRKQTQDKLQKYFATIKSQTPCFKANTLHLFLHLIEKSAKNQNYKIHTTNAHLIHRKGKRVSIEKNQNMSSHFSKRKKIGGTQSHLLKIVIRFDFTQTFSYLCTFKKHLKFQHSQKLNPSVTDNEKTDFHHIYNPHYQHSRMRQKINFQSAGH